MGARVTDSASCLVFLAAKLLDTASLVLHTGTSTVVWRLLGKVEFVSSYNGTGFQGLPRGHRLTSCTIMVNLGSYDVATRDRCDDRRLF